MPRYSCLWIGRAVGDASGNHDDCKNVALNRVVRAPGFCGIIAGGFRALASMLTQMKDPF